MTTQKKDEKQDSATGKIGRKKIGIETVHLGEIYDTEEREKKNGRRKKKKKKKTNGYRKKINHQT